MRYFLLTAFFVALAVAQESDTMSVYSGDSLTVWEERLVSSPAAEFVNGEFIPDSAIYQSFSPDFAEFMQYDAEIFVKSGRLPGETFTPMVCGGDMSHYRAALDGIPVAFPQMMIYDLSTQPMWSLGGIEIIPGSHSALYGTGGMAAAFNLITPYNFPEGAKTKILLAQGDYNFENLGVAMEHNLFKYLKMHISGTRTKSGGDRPDENSRIENLSAKIFSPLTEYLNIELYAQSHRGWIDYYSYGALSHLRNDNALGALHINGDFAGVLARASLQIEKYDQNYYDDWNSSHHQGDVLTVDLRATKKYGGFAPTVFAEHRSYDLKSTDSGDHKVSTFAAGAQTKYQSEKTSALFAARVDRDFQENINPSFGAGIRQSFAPSFAAKLSAGYGFRSPTPNDLWYHSIWGSYSEPEIDTVTGDTTGWNVLVIYGSRGDTALKSEGSFNINLGFEYDLGEIVRIAPSAFWTKYSDLIEWVPVYVPVEDGPDSSLYVPNNVSDATLYGATVDAQLISSENVEFGIRYTYTYGQNDSTGERLLERPKHFVAAKLGGKLTFWDGELELGAKILPQYVDNIARRKTDPMTYQSHIATVSPGFVLGARLWFRYKDFELFATGVNLTDNKYELYTGEKALGRQIRFGISWNFRD